MAIREALAIALGLVAVSAHGLIETGAVRGRSLHVPVTYVDYEKLEAGSTVEYDFRLCNKGNRPVGILDLRKTCSCTSVTVSHETVPPGREAHVWAVLETRGRKGPLSADIYLMTDDPKLTSLTLTLTAMLLSPFDCRPEVIDLGEVAPGEIFTRMVTLGGASASPLWIADWRSELDGVVVDRIVDGHDPNTEKIAFLSITTGHTGRAEGRVIFVPDDPGLEPDFVWVRYQVREAVVKANPSTLFLSARQGEKQLTVAVSNKFRIISDLAFIQLKEYQKEPDLRNYTCVVDPASLRDLKRGRVGELQITDENGQRVGVVPVFH